MYDTFGDKRSLYIEALQRYQAESSADLFERLRTASSPLKALGEVLLGIAGEPPATRSKGCMAVNAATEIGQSDADIAAMLNSSALVCEAAFERVVREAKRKGEVRAEVNERTAGKFLLSTIRGLRVSAKAGASSETLRDIAAFAIASLSA